MIEEPGADYHGVKILAQARNPKGACVDVRRCSDQKKLALCTFESRLLYN